MNKSQKHLHWRISFNKEKQRHRETIFFASKVESYHFYTPLIHSEHGVGNNTGPKKQLVGEQNNQLNHLGFERHVD